MEGKKKRGDGYFKKLIWRKLERHKPKVILRPVGSGCNISLSISSNGINSKNRIILHKAQAVWDVVKSLGIG